MSLGGVAAASAAAALLYYSRRGGLCGAPGEVTTHENVHSAPQTWAESLFFFSEGLRYTYSETLGRWRAADLLIGLAYLSRREGGEHPAADIARQARPLGESMNLEQLEEAMEELRIVERLMRYCFVMKERNPAKQREMFSILGIEGEDILQHEMLAGVLKPSFVLVRDRQLCSIVLSIRGTHSFRDMFTSLTGASKPHHLVDSNGVVLGYSHFGMLAAARWIKGQTMHLLESALAANPGYSLRVMGHSLGGGTAALLTMMLRERGGPFAGATCLALACPSCMTLELAASCAGYVTSVVCGADIIPTISPGSADLLREDVTRSSWFLELRREVRTSSVVRAVENGLRGVSYATLNATSWTTAKLSSCYPRREGPAPASRMLKRRNSDDLGAALDEEAGGQQQQRWGVESAADEVDALLLDEEQQGIGGQSGSATVAALRNATTASVLGMLGSPPPSLQPHSARHGSTLVGSPPPPAGLGGSSRSGAHHHSGHAHHRHGSGRQGAPWGRRLMGWGQQMGALTGRGAVALGSGSVAAVRSTGGLLARVWSQSCAPPSADGSKPLLEAGGMDAGLEKGAAGQAPAQDVKMFEGEEEGGSGQGEAPEHKVEDAINAADRDGLVKELTLRMSLVEAAVCDAEDEERRQGEDPTVPSVIRPGSYGTSGSRPPVSPPKDPRWKRMMYPAGRILHMVPAHLVEGFSIVQPPSKATFDAFAAADSNGGSEDGWVVGGDVGTLLPDESQQSPPPRPRPGPNPAGSPVTPRPSPLQQQAKVLGRDAGLSHQQQAGLAELSALSLHGMDVDEEGGPAERWGGGEGGPGSEDGVWVSPGGATWQGLDSPRGSETPTSPIENGNGSNGNGNGPSPPPGEYILLESVPQRAYGRIKLCRRMLADHFIPSYLAALESAQRSLAARRAQVLAQSNGLGRPGVAAAEALD